MVTLEEMFTNYVRFWAWDPAFLAQDMGHILRLLLSFKSHVVFNTLKQSVNLNSNGTCGPFSLNVFMLPFQAKVYQGLFYSLITTSAAYQPTNPPTHYSNVQHRVFLATFTSTNLIGLSRTRRPSNRGGPGHRAGYHSPAGLCDGLRTASISPRVVGSLPRLQERGKG